MGFKEAAVIAPVSFLLGVLFICFTVDHRILWGQVTQKDIEDGFHFYKAFYNAPPAIRTLLHSMFLVTLAGFFAKLHKWDDSAMFFDGSSIAAFVFGLCVYFGVTVPGLRTINLPVTEVEDPDVQVESIRVLSAGNVIISGCLVFVLLLQAGQAYARRSEEQALAKLEAEKRQTAIAAAETKKEQ